MIMWLKSNKKKVIGFLAVVTTTVLLVLIKQSVLLSKASEIKQAIDTFKDNEQVTKMLLSVTIMDILSKFMIGLTFVYSAFLGIHFIQFDLKNKLKLGEK